MQLIKKLENFRINGKPQAVKMLIQYYVVGVVGLSLPYTRDFFILLMAPSLLLTMGFLLLFHREWSPLKIVIFAAIALLGYFVETLGVLTGEVFGSYAYGHALGLIILETPLMIGVNWIMLVYCFWAIAGRLSWPVWLKVPMAALLMVAYDFILEPVAIRLDMWYWAGDVIPFQNYAAWFAISLFFFSLLAVLRIRIQNPLAAWLIGLHTAFFLLLNVSVRFL